MKFQIMTTFWGDMHFDWFKRGCLNSLASRSNKKTIVDNCSTWNINTEKRFFAQIEEVVRKEFPWIIINLRDRNELRRYVDDLQSALCLQIKGCLDIKERFLFAPPDTIFADGTIASMLKVGRDPGTCVAIAHPRVLPKILDEIGTNALNPAEMVSLCFKNLHRSWTDAEIGHPRRSSFMSGVSWEEISPNLYSISHRLPTIYFADFRPEDLQYFQTCIGFGDWDHVWASRIYENNRMRYIGSSDGGFICELTEPNKNVPPVRPGDPDEFWKNEAQNHFNKQFRVIFRGEA